MVMVIRHKRMVYMLKEKEKELGRGKREEVVSYSDS